MGTLTKESDAKDFQYHDEEWSGLGISRIFFAWMPTRKSLRHNGSSAHELQDVLFRTCSALYSSSAPAPHSVG
jgi:hypothetical protein